MGNTNPLDKRDFGITFLCPQKKGAVEQVLSQTPINSWVNWAVRFYPTVTAFWGSEWDVEELRRLDPSECIVVIACKKMMDVVTAIRGRFNTSKPLLFHHDGWINSHYSGDPNIGWFEDDFFRACALCDAGLCHHPNIRAFYEYATGRPVAFAPMSFPPNFREYRKPWKERDRNKVIIGNTLRCGRGVEPALLVMRKHFPNHRLVLQDSQIKPFTKRFGDDFNFELYQPMDQLEWLSKMSDGYLAIAGDERGSPGRFQSDMAALGIPCITNERNFRGRHLWPELLLDFVFEMEQLKHLIYELLSNETFWDAQVRLADSMLDAFCSDRSIDVLRESIRMVMGRAINFPLEYDE